MRWVVAFVFLTAFLLAEAAFVAPRPAYASLSYLGEWGAGTGAGRVLSTPTDVDLAPDGTVFVADCFANKIVRFSPSGAVLASWEPTAAWPDFDPRWLGVGRDGTVYAAGFYTEYLLHFTASGVRLDDGWGNGLGAGQGSMSLCVAADGTIFSVQMYGVAHYSAAGALLSSWGGWGPGQFSALGVTVAQDGTVYVGDFVNNRIQHFSAAGTYLGQFGSTGTGPGQFQGITDVAAAPDGTLFVVEQNSARIQQVRSDGSCVSISGGPGAGPGQFNQPKGLVVSPDGIVYVADFANQRVQRFAITPNSSIQGVPSGWASSDVTLTLSADAPYSALTGIYFRVGTTEPEVYGGPITISSEGTTTIDYWSSDASGNVEATNTASVHIDKTPPATSSDATAGYVSPALVSLSASDSVSGVAGTFFSVDGGSWQSGRAVTVYNNGAHSLSYFSVDLAGNREPTQTVTFDVVPDFEALEGADRYDTSIKTSRATWTQGACDAVVFATGTNYPDALGAAGLAGTAGCPILLSSGSYPSAAIRAEVTRLTKGRTGAITLYVVGGTGAVTSAWEQGLRVSFPKATVKRLAGSSRYGTANAVAREIRALMDRRGLTYSGSAIFVTGSDFPDALLASPIAFSRRMPIFLVGPVDAALKDSMRQVGVKNAYIVGSTASVPQTTQNALGSFLGTGHVSRPCAASGRYAQSVKVAEWAVSLEATGAPDFSWASVGVATGGNFPDALGAAPLVGSRTGILLLTPSPSLDPGVGTAVTAHKSLVGSVTYFGGTAAVSQSVRDAVAQALR